MELSDAESIILNQNAPSPFADQTTITYRIPESVRDARIIFNNKGVVIREVMINERGNDSLKVYAADLSSGVYTYSIIADASSSIPRRW